MQLNPFAERRRLSHQVFAIGFVARHDFHVWLLR
jgi:hypothetical protein